MNDTLSDLEKQVDDAYKKSWLDAMAEYGVADGWLLPKQVRDKLADEGRKAWEHYYSEGNLAARAASRAARVVQKRESFENTFGVSDLAPPRRGAVSPQEPAAARPAPTSPAPAAEPARTTTAPAAAAVRTARPSPAPAAARPSTAAPEPMDFGTADDVNRAVKSLFGTTMEEN